MVGNLAGGVLPFEPLRQRGQGFALDAGVEGRVAVLRLYLGFGDYNGVGVWTIGIVKILPVMWVFDVPARNFPRWLAGFSVVHPYLIILISMRQYPKV